MRMQLKKYFWNLSSGGKGFLKNAVLYDQIISRSDYSVNEREPAK